MEDMSDSIETYATEFYNKANRFTNDECENYESLQGTDKRLRRKRFEFLKNKRSKRLPRFDDLCEFYKNEELENIKKYFIKKIIGIYKHPQSKKTAICNSIILTNLANKISTMCIAKDTLQANQQWFERLLTDLDNAYPGNDYIVYVISSAKQTYVKRNVKHYNSIDKFITHISSNTSQKPYILFVCSNNTRVCDLKIILDVCVNINYNPLFDIIWDEAHNKKEGIPSKRSISEFLIIHPRVITFRPCTATPDDLHEETTLFQLKNLEANALDYTRFNDYKSDSPEYSSLQKATPIYLEELRKSSNYKNYGITHYEKELFKRHYKDAKIRKQLENETEDVILEEIERDREYRRRLEYCQFMKRESEFYNDGLNLIDNIHEKYYKGIHLIHTPLRNAFTESLIVHALKQSYHPILIGLYGSAIHVYYGNVHQIITDKGLLNEQINQILKTIKEKGVNTDSVIILGNYSPTGESISFYHPVYGPLTSSALLGEYIPSQANQSFSRLNYVHPLSFIEPEKFMIGESETISNAIMIEKQNDLRIDRFRDNEKCESGPFVFTRQRLKTDDSNISIPARFEYDGESQNIRRMKEISKVRTTQEERDEFMRLLFFELKADNISIADPTGKFNETYIMKSKRCYKKPTEEEEEQRKRKLREKGKECKAYEEYYRFDSYQANHRQNMSYMNEKNTIGVGECEMLGCVDKYILQKEVKITNSVNVFWISYRFPIPPC